MGLLIRQVYRRNPPPPLTPSASIQSDGRTPNNERVSGQSRSSIMVKSVIDRYRCCEGSNLTFAMPPRTCPVLFLHSYLTQFLSDWRIAGRFTAEDHTIGCIRSTYHKFVCRTECAILCSECCSGNTGSDRDKWAIIEVIKKDGVYE